MEMAMPMAEKVYGEICTSACDQEELDPVIFFLRSNPRFGEIRSDGNLIGALVWSRENGRRKCDRQKNHERKRKMILTIYLVGYSEKEFSRKICGESLQFLF